ncbi:F/Y rich C-terminus-domain-containing protein [Mucor mucedo]|uniref:F/Y rich C-terminus-domain-containing protein n=1 Tax=Mucor mucedo TaxID=29922 RepID=UPI00221FE96D|nr:F/Y rich C-terminus-domain-containing protein [Mucor mucedo]KAI7875088.1 F/Y rich C-terminus-domain-containing protein [Mucor mucedo]
MMDNRIVAPSLSNVSGSRLSGNQDDFPTEALESTLDNLLEKNSELTKHLEKALLKISRLRKQRSVLLDVIVKVNSNDEAYEDDDNVDDTELLSDIDSEVESSDDDPEVEIIPLPQTKRRKVQAKRQRGTKSIIVPKDESGNYIFPVQIGRTLLLSLGNIIPNENFYNQNYIFPVGYSMQRTYKSMVNEHAFTTYTCSIDKDAFDKPIFCIQAEDAPDIIIQKNTPTAAWSEVLKRSNELRKKEFKNTVSGPEYYGLSFATIKKMIQELPGAEECLGYQWVDL